MLPISEAINALTATIQGSRECHIASYRYDLAGLFLLGDVSCYAMTFFYAVFLNTPYIRCVSCFG